MSQASLTSSVTDIRWLDDVGLQLVWTGSPTGSFAVQVSADYNPGGQSGTIANAGNWTPLTLTYFNGSTNVTATSVPTSVGSPIYLDLSLLSAPYIRLVYTKVSGTGTLTSTITAKEL